jgi:UDP-N-acetylmuramate dehydrogenase
MKPTMHTEKNYSLKPYHTFAVDALAKYFVRAESIKDISMILSDRIYKDERKLILGGGSNILFTKDYDGLVLNPAIKGISVIDKRSGYLIVKAGAGENWDEFVEWTVENNLGGLENLSLIPGNVGACPVQNIGAYGVEAGNLIERVECIDIMTGQELSFSGKECNFGYRSSIFKQEFRNRLIITAVYFKLAIDPVFVTHYGQLKQEIELLGGLSLIKVRQAVINIRQSKLPDPMEIPNAGSFFKNPVVDPDNARKLKSHYPEIVCFQEADGRVKIAAGWLIEYLGWKGKAYGGAGVHKKQALVLVNHNNATGNEILELAGLIYQSVKNEFGIELEFEVNVI